MSSQLFSLLNLDSTTPPRPQPFRDDRLRLDEQEGLVAFKVYHNDGTQDSYEILTSLKNIFQKQLPKMPKEYITRLVYDRRHQSLAIIKAGRKVVGGITYRSFPSRHFAEIVFCAVASTEQVKGYGSYLMSHLKEYVKRNEPGPILYFLTYADNYAIGYFKKQGFTTEITLEKSVWGGAIKDYDGGTLMQCTMAQKMDYLSWPRIVHEQQRQLLMRIHEKTGCGRVYEGLQSFPISPEQVPGAIEAGWTKDMVGETHARPRLYEVLRPLLSELQSHPASWPFRSPVSLIDVPDYLTVIHSPMDLSTIESKLESTPSAYQTMNEFINDFRLIISNCKAYNDAETTYCKNANLLDKFFGEKLKARDIK